MLKTNKIKLFQYGKKEMNYLKSKDEKLGKIIDEVGKVDIEIDGDLFSFIVRNIIGQQISLKVANTIYYRIIDKYKIITPKLIDGMTEQELRSFGFSQRKIEYVKNLTAKVLDGSFNLDLLYKMSDDMVISYMSKLRGIGVWTAEMTLLCLQRPNIFSFSDIAMLRGLRMVYGHNKITKTQFEKYRKKFSPYCTTASLYFWIVANGSVKSIKDRELNLKNRKKVVKYK